MADGYGIEVTLDLAALGLAHAEGSKCRCKGKAHKATVSADLEDHGLHADVECLPEETEQRALQSLHEQAHPDGVAFTENCREPGCVDLWSRS